jgi:sortase (surface protein transpeptidase)
MKPLRALALLAFFAGAAILIVGLISPDSGDKPIAAHEFDSRPPTSTPTPSPEPSLTPTPTPTPFDGKVARMKIPSLKVDYPIEELGLKAGTNELDTPHDAIGKIGWYSIYAKPGYLKNAVFSAHVNYNGKDGPFANLRKIQDGDEIDVLMDGGPEYRYHVFRLKRYAIDLVYAGGDPSKVIDMGRLIDAPDRPAGKEWITLITCSCEPGRLINVGPDGFGECVDRDVVVAERFQ